MKPKSNAFLLNEMLLIIVLVGLLAALAVKPIRFFYKNSGGIHRAFEQQTQIDAMLRRFGRDVENASSVRVLDADERLGGAMLTFSGLEGAVTYQLSEGSVTRAEGQSTEAWELPQMHLDWRLLTLDGGRTAVAVTTWQQPKGHGNADEPRFKGSHLYVVNLNGGLAVKEGN